MLWPVFFFVAVVLLLVMWRPRKEKQQYTDLTPEEKYLLAKKIFTRDPGSFKDGDSDGVEDILEK